MKYIRKNGIKDPGSAITHGIALILAMVGTLPLLLKAAREPDHLHVIAMAVFMLSMILLYLASTVYHTFDVNGKVNRRLKKFDHMMISVLIAGSYTPICLIALHGRTGIVLCALVWAAAIGGILVKAFWINCPKWFSSVLYIAMGWLCVLAFHPLFLALSRPAFGWLLAGGRETILAIPNSHSIVVYGILDGNLVIYGGTYYEDAQKQEVLDAINIMLQTTEIE